MKKTLAVALSSLLLSMPALAAEKAYVCKFLGGKQSVGEITLTGDVSSEPLKISAVAVEGKHKKFKTGVTDSAYLYLFEPSNGQNSYALELVVYDDVQSFEMSVYPEHHLVMGSLKIARYKCEAN